MRHGWCARCGSGVFVPTCRLHWRLRRHRVQENGLATRPATGAAVVRANRHRAVNAVAAVVRRALCVLVLQRRHGVLDRRCGRACRRGDKQRRRDPDAIRAGWLVGKRVLERRRLLVSTVRLVLRRSGVPRVPTVPVVIM